MCLEQEVDLVRQIPVLRHLDLAAQKMLCFASERVYYAAGDVIFCQGDSADAAYIVIDGLVEILVTTPAGRLRLNGVERHGIFGEIGTLGDLPRSATAVAATPLELLRVPRDVFHRVIHDNPEAARSLTLVLAERLSRTTGLLSEVASRRAS
jgi:CRP-like cAMP-binding protein